MPRLLAKLRFDGSFVPALKVPFIMSFFIHLYRCSYRLSDPISEKEYVIIIPVFLYLTILNIFILVILIWSIMIIIHSNGFLKASFTVPAALTQCAAARPPDGDAVTRRIEVLILQDH